MIVSDLIRTVLEDLRIVGVADTIEAGVQDIVFRRLKTMLDSWGAIRQNIYATTEETFSLTVGKNPYTIGSSGDFDTVRPVRITYAYIKDSDVDYPLDIFQSESEYKGITMKATSTRPEGVWYEKQFPLGYLWFDYVPDKAYELHLSSHKRLLDASAIKLSTDLSFPEGYEQALITNLAVRSANALGKPLTQDMVLLASGSLKTIQAVNLEITPQRYDTELFNRRGGR